MDLAQTPEGRPTAARPGLARFIPAARLSAVCAELRARRFLVAGATPTPLTRGRLRELIDEAVEGALAMRGALPPCGSVEEEIEPSIRDQLFRAKAVGLAGIAVAMPRLGGATGDRGELDASDGTALAAWMDAVREGPIVLLLDEADRGVRVVTPVPLSKLVPEAPPRPAPRPPVNVEAKPAAPAEAPAARAAAPSALAEPPTAVNEAPSALAEPPTAVNEAPTALAEPPTAVNEAPTARPTPPTRRTEAPTALTEAPTRVTEAPNALDDTPPALAPTAPKAALLKDPPAKPARESRSEHILGAAERRAFAMELDAARGPKPARIIDQLFTTRYIPLLRAVSCGEADAGVRGVVDAWRTSFEHSYRDSYASIRVTAKRPSMVFDAPDIAAKIGRLNGARAVRLLLVDSMSYELGERVMARLKPRVEDRAVNVERSLLWAALPTTTTQQMSLLAKGAEGLRDAPMEAEPEAEIARGRAVSTLRRERLGAREVMKLDCVEARLRNAGPPYEERLDAIAEEVAQVVARFMDTLQPRTLLYMFGDHGFRLMQSSDGSSTGPATQGGASPEEVLVPGYSWLAGGVH